MTTQRKLQRDCRSNAEQLQKAGWTPAGQLADNQWETVGGCRCLAGRMPANYWQPTEPEGPHEPAGPEEPEEPE
eukprot:5337631-Lingulodinium_polyedra.AAC.1